MVTFILGIVIGATLAIVADHFASKYLAKVEAKIKADLADAEALKKSAEAELAKIEKAL